MRCIAALTQSPSLLWPEDLAWCVTTDVDMECTFVSGEQRLVDWLVARQSLDAHGVEPSSPLR